MTEILAGIEAEIQATEGVSWKELRLPANRYRMLITITLQIGKAAGVGHLTMEVLTVG